MVGVNVRQMNQFMVVRNQGSGLYFWTNITKQKAPSQTEEIVNAVSAFQCLFILVYKQHKTASKQTSIYIW